jgi:hypothetical protein
MGKLDSGLTVFVDHERLALRRLAAGSELPVVAGRGNDSRAIVRERRVRQPRAQRREFATFRDCRHRVIGRFERRAGGGR